jgi:starch synthase
MIMKILHAASECLPLAKTGGLADVVGALPPAQRSLGHDARIVLPGYRGLRDQLQQSRSIGQLSAHGLSLQIVAGELADGLPIYLVCHAGLYERDGDPYRDAAGREFADNMLRFAAFCVAVRELASGFDAGFVADVAHLHDWQAGLAAAWLRDAAQRPRIVYTIHNLAYQGEFDRASFDALALPAHWWVPDGLEFWGRASCMKAGIVYADVVTTVSPSYAREIQTPEFGCGLDGVLRWRSAVLYGILNGIDERVWDPARDPLIERRYALADVAVGKATNKYLLQSELGLSPGDWPLVVFIGRLAAQKGADLIVAAASELLKLPAQFAILASGEEHLQQALRHFAGSAPAGQVGLRLVHDERLAHRFNAAADLLLMPSRFEPCGLNQMYAQRYGAMPVVRRTGGLIDTVVDATEATLADGSATGVQFADADVGGVLYGVRRGLQLFENAEIRARMRATAMSRDFSWAASARAYLDLYRGESAAP